MTAVRLAAVLFVFGALAAAAFQVALAAGAPWGELTMGGAFGGRLPIERRIVAALSAITLLGFAALVTARAGLALRRWHAASRRLIWVVVAYSATGVILNAATPSPRERALWLPVAVVMLVSSVVVGRSNPVP
jgi:uncharacterized membrane protein YhaH (DUF805 family)